MENQLENALAEKPRKRFNLLIEGTGVRFHKAPEKRSMPKYILFSTIIILTAAVASAFYFKPEYLQTPSPVDDTAKVSEDEDEPLPSAIEQAVNNPEQGALTEKAAVKPVVRFGLFASRDNAERMAQELQKQDVFADIRVVSRTAPALTVRAWPIKDVSKLGEVWKELEKINVAQPPRIEQQYILVGPLWSKESSSAVAQKMRELGFHSSEEEGSAEREMYEVVSMPLDSEVVAQYKIIEWRAKGFEGVVEK